LETGFIENKNEEIEAMHFCFLFYVYSYKRTIRISIFTSTQLLKHSYAKISPHSFYILRFYLDSGLFSTVDKFFYVPFKFASSRMSRYLEDEYYGSSYSPLMDIPVRPQVKYNYNYYNYSAGPEPYVAPLPLTPYARPAPVANPYYYSRYAHPYAAAAAYSPYVSPAAYSPYASAAVYHPAAATYRPYYY
jgi:hypothetical protein